VKIRAFLYFFKYRNHINSVVSSPDLDPDPPEQGTEDTNNKRILLRARKPTSTSSQTSSLLARTTSNSVSSFSMNTMNPNSNPNYDDFIGGSQRQSQSQNRTSTSTSAPPVVVPAPGQIEIEQKDEVEERPRVSVKTVKNLSSSTLANNNGKKNLPNFMSFRVI
jgi:hypothetical protein